MNFPLAARRRSRWTAAFRDRARSCLVMGPPSSGDQRLWFVRGRVVRLVVSAAVEQGVPCLALAASLGYIDSYRRERMPANLLQGQRDYFGAHKYERVDKPRGKSFHTLWTE